VYFGGCDYLRLSSHPAVLAAVREALDDVGLNVSASRVTTGNHWLYQELEAKLAAFFGFERAVLVPAGYQANLVLAQALAGQFTHAFLDEAAHASLLDAAQFLNCQVVRFRHREPAALKEALAKARPLKRAIVLTDGVFGRDGSLAPLADYVAVLPEGGAVLVDDAHGAGVLGKTGQGTAEYLEVNRTQLLQTVTLSKALGVYGGVVLTAAPVARRITGTSRLFAGATPLPLPLAAGALAALNVLRHDPAVRARLVDNTAYVKDALRTSGWPVEATPCPIVPFFPRNAAETKRVHRQLWSRGIWPSLIRYPGANQRDLYRFALSSEHTRPQLDALVAALGACAA
jgi:7-keto-8-aminopelargonate synthetase-like enzyme